MRRRSEILLLCLVSGCLPHWAGAVEPRWDIPPAIAKLPEKADFLGDWVRFDDSYRLEIEPGEGDDTVVVRYFNPEPINVESATWSENDGQPALTVVLRDTGYEGSTYRLVFMAERQILLGQYARPGMEPFDVYFVRQAE